MVRKWSDEHDHYRKGHLQKRVVKSANLQKRVVDVADSLSEAQETKEAMHTRSKGVITAV